MDFRRRNLLAASAYSDSGGSDNSNTFYIHSYFVSQAGRALTEIARYFKDKYLIDGNTYANLHITSVDENKLSTGTYITDWINDSANIYIRAHAYQYANIVNEPFDTVDPGQSIHEPISGASYIKIRSASVWIDADVINIGLCAGFGFINDVILYTLTLDLSEFITVDRPIENLSYNTVYPVYLITDYDYNSWYSNSYKVVSYKTITSAYNSLSGDLVKTWYVPENNEDVYIDNKKVIQMANYGQLAGAFFDSIFKCEDLSYYVNNYYTYDDYKIHNIFPMNIEVSWEEGKADYTIDSLDNLNVPLLYNWYMDNCIPDPQYTNGETYIPEEKLGQITIGGYAVSFMGQSAGTITSRYIEFSLENEEDLFYNKLNLSSTHLFGGIFIITESSLYLGWDS